MVMIAQDVIDYIAQLPASMTASFTSLTAQEQGKQVFSAMEMLSDFYPSDKVTARTAALQTLFSIEAEGEEFARLKRHGVQNFSTKGTSVSFSRVDSLAPDVISILGQPKQKGGYVGRMI